jgi:hypothetical protein
MTYQHACPVFCPTDAAAILAILEVNAQPDRDCAGFSVNGSI